MISWLQTRRWCRRPLQTMAGDGRDVCQLGGRGCIISFAAINKTTQPSSRPGSNS
ncbi:hypothetical protein BKA80DRAFT_270131 [Phyllosticta citrichinensis]